MITHHRLFLVLMLVLSLVISLAFLAAGWFLDDTFFRSLMHTGTVINGRLPESLAYKLWKGFYIFFDKNAQNQAFLKDQGIIPWWTTPATQVAFWRPISSLTLFLDFKLWPDNSIVIHLHSIIWFMLLAAAAAVLYRIITGNNRFALLAAILFLFNRINYFTVAFISNRHALVAVFFSLITMLIYMKARGKSRLPAYGLFLFTLFCSEVGLICFAYILPYTLFLEQKTPWEKIRQLLPFLALILVWRLCYNLLGFGAYGSELYVDPVNSPLAFLFTAFKRFPLLLVSLFLGFPADFINCFSEQAQVISALVVYLSAGAALCYFIKSRQGNPQLYFWLTAVCCSVIPLCIPVPADRNLLFASFGAAGCIAQVLNKTAGEKKPPVFRKWILGLIISLNLLEGAAGVFVVPAGMVAIHKQMETLYDFGDDPDLADKNLIIVASPYVHYFYSYWIERDLKHLPMPLTMQLLAPGLAPVAITRVDSRSLLVRPGTGFYPGSPVNSGQPVWTHFSMLHFYRLLERSFIDRAYVFSPGDEFHLQQFDATVTRLTDDGRIAEALFTFPVPLESAAYQWITWNPGKSGYEPFLLPAVGDTIVIDPGRDFPAH